MIATLLTAAIAAVSPSQGIGVRDIVEIADIASPVVSPDGRFVAFRVDRPSIERNRVDLTWYIARVDTAAPAWAIADGGSGLFNSAGTLIAEVPTWSLDSRAIYFRALIGGAVQIWRASLDSNAAAQITADAADVRNFVLTAGGRSIVYRTGATRGAIALAEARSRDSGVLVDATVDLALGVSGGSIVNGRSASQRLTGHWFERRGLLDDQPEQVKIFTLERAAFASAYDDQVSGIGETGSSSTIEEPGAEMKREACRAIRCGTRRIIRVQLIPDSTDVLVTTETAAFEQSLYRWRKEAASARVLMHTDGLASGGRDPVTPCGITPVIAICVQASATVPPRLVRISLQTGAASTMFDPNRNVRSRIETPARQLTWRDAQGRQFTGQLLLPRRLAKGQRVPLVIDYYRCPGFMRGGVGDETPLLPLASRGIATLCVNAVFAAATQDSQADYAAALSGIRAIVAQLGNDGIVDTSRVGMAGLSFGSEVVMWVARHSSLLAAASIASGQLEPGYYWYNAVRGRDVPDALKAAWDLGDPDHDRAGWAAIASARDTDAIRVPLLMQLPELEARWSMELYAKLSRSATPVELYAFPNAAHVKSQPRQKLAAYGRNLDWFCFWLAGQEDFDPTKSDQYASWRHLAARRIPIVKIEDRTHP
ncbi:dipeptidyl aminopeptidase/acylaminoacyl peptidase [Sphingomonas sp. UYAg733]